MVEKKKDLSLILIVIAMAAAIFFFAVTFHFVNEIDVYRGFREKRRLILLLWALLVVFASISVLLIIMMKKKGARIQEIDNSLRVLYGIVSDALVKCRYVENDWVVLSANEAFYLLIGYSKEEFKEKFCNRIAGIMYPPLFDSARMESIRQLSDTGKLKMEISIVCADGIVKLVWLNGESIKNENNEEEIYVVLSDISKITEIDQELRYFNTIKNLTPAIFFEWNVVTGVVTTSSNFSLIFGVPGTSGNFPYNTEQTYIVYKDDLNKFIRSFEEMKSGKKVSTVEFRLVNKAGITVWYRNSMTTVFDDDGKPTKVIGVLSDVDDEKRKLETAEEAARRDPLTQLYNKTTTEKLIQNYLDSSQNPAVLIMLDIDNFKGINDKLGHLYGDAVLSELAYTLGSLFRGSDIAGRIGGDEFAVFMTNVGDMSIVENKAKKLLTVFNRSFKSNNINYKISCSMGISKFPEDGNTFSELMGKADNALYYSKNYGKNRYVFYDEISKTESDYKGMNYVETNDKLQRINVIQKNFRENIADYILRLFYEYDDVELAVPVLLDFIGKSYDVGRIDVSVFNEDQKYFNILYEWCNDNVESLKNLNTLIVADDWENIKRELDENNIICCEDVQGEVNECFKNDDMKERGVKSLMLCYIVEKGVRRAVICLEYYDEKHYFTLEEKDALKTISSTIGLFVLRFREQQILIENKIQQKNRESMLDEMDEIVYVSDIETYELYYLNKMGRNELYLKDKDYTGKKCYEYIYNREKPCNFCTNHLLNRDKFYIWEGTNPITNRHYMLKDKLLEWNGKNARIEWAIDLTEKENQTRALSSRLEIEKALLDGIEEMLSASDLDQAMALVLKRIGEFYDGDRSYILEMDNDNISVSMTYEWLSEGSPAQIDIFHNLKLEDSPVWKEAFCNGKALLLEDIITLKKDHPKEYERIAVQGITTMYAVPLMLNGELGGFLGIDTPRKFRGDLYILDTISSFVSDQIGKRRTTLNHQ